MADERGSIVSVANGRGSSSSGGRTRHETGTTLAINSYDEFGIPASTNLGRFGYSGGSRPCGARARHDTQTWLPEVGLYYYKARMYSPTLGRFMQTDPIGYADGMNWYAYVGGDPVNFVDPLGEASIGSQDDDGPSDLEGGRFFTPNEFYVCRASRRECREIEEGLRRLRSLLRSGLLGRSDRDRLRSVLNRIGRAGQNNGVFAEAGTIEGTPLAHASDGVITFDFGKVRAAANRYSASNGGISGSILYQNLRAVIIAHEGDHILTPVGTEAIAELLRSELSAYSLGAAAAEGLFLYGLGYTRRDETSLRRAAISSCTEAVGSSSACVYVAGQIWP